jgi:hypothetical protein
MSGVVKKQKYTLALFIVKVPSVRLVEVPNINYCSGIISLSARDLEVENGSVQSADLSFYLARSCCRFRRRQKENR